MKMAKWIEITAGDLQRMAENAYMFRRSYTNDFAYLCTKINDARPLSDDMVMECYGKNTDGVEYYCDAMTRVEFAALTQDQVGVDTEDAPPVDQPADVADQAMYDPDVAQYYSQQLDAWGGITNATRYTADEALAVQPFPPDGHPNAEWRTVPPL